MILLILFIIGLIIGLPVEASAGIVVIVYTFLLWVDHTDEHNRRKERDDRADRSTENGRR